MPPFVIATTLAQTPAADRLEIGEVVIAVDGTGTITAVEPANSTGADALLRTDAEVIRTAQGELLLPGMIDLHVHAPQWPQLGTGLDLPLDRWLFEHTFPLEARYTDHAFAVSVWDDMVPTLLRHGTTTAVYFGTNDTTATTLLAGACARHGQRAWVGRVAMDHPDGTPPWYRDASAAEGVDASARSIDEIVAIGSELVRPIITPRFTPACTDQLLHGLADLAERTGCLVQTHADESDWVRGYAQDRFGSSETAAFAAFGLLRDHTVLAHGNLVDDVAAGLIAHAGAGIAHCPLSNAYFANAVLPVRRLIVRGVRVGLGTDIAGGASPSLLHQCHDAVTVSRLLDDGTDASVAAAERGTPASRIDTTTAFWLATAGGADVLGEPLGLIAPGRRFDAFTVRTGDGTNAVRTWPDLDDAERTFEKVVRLAGAAETARVWVNGRTVIDHDVPA